MPPSHVRKEEAELRQIAKQSRTARKEAQERERKQRQRALRAAAKNGDAAAADADATSAAAKKKRGAIILPDEVKEMRQRLLGDKADAVTDAGAKKSSKKAQRAAGKKANGAGASSAAAAASGSPSAAAASSLFLVPSFHQEVHFKKKIFFVDVVLHHVPHQKIDVRETTNQQLVVDTSAFTKKYRLVLPFPDGMRCDAAAANYDFEHGVLSCKLPILDGTLPANLEDANGKMLEQMRQQRALRFRVSQDGDLTVRTRQALLAPTAEAQAALLQAAKEAKKKTGEDGEETKEAGGKAKKRAREAAADADAEETAEGQPAKAAKKNGKAIAAAAPAAKPDVFQAEHVKAMEAAKAAAEKVHLSMRERLQLAKTVQATRQERLQTRSQRKERKEEQKQNSFQRVLEEQKRRLMTQATMQQPPTPTPRASAKAGGAAKSVRFAES